MRLDPLLLLATLGLVAGSLIALNVATKNDIPGQPDYYVYRQAAYAGVGLVLMYAVSRIDYSRLRELRYPVYGLLLGIILLVLVVAGATRGTRAWIELPFFNFQPSELGKVLLIVSLSAFLVDRMRRMGRDTTARIMLLGLLPTMLVILEPDLGSAMVYVAGTLALLFVAGAPWKHFAALGALFAVAIALVLVAAPMAGVQVLEPYQVDRLTSFLHPSADPGDEGYQQHQSLIAMGSGEKTGRGAENATQTSLNFLPEHHTDFIFAVVGETLRFRGLRAHPLALRATYMARFAYPDRCEEPVRRADRRRHHRDAAVPGLREHRDERGDHADHRRDRPAAELRRLVDARDISGPRPAPLRPRAGARDGGAQGEGDHLPMRNQREKASAGHGRPGRDPSRHAGGRRRPGGGAEVALERAGARSLRSRPGTASPRSISSAAAAGRSSATSTRARSTTSWPGSRPRSSTSGSTRTASCTSTRSCIPGRSRRAAGAAPGRAITDLLSPGQEIVVQVVKDPLKTKGARLSMELTIAGRYMVYAPTGEGIGVSRRLEDKERDRLRKEAKQLDLGGGGAIIRTAAHGATRGDFERELQYLFKLNEVLEKRVRETEAPALVFQEADLSVRVVRDIFSAHFEKAVVDDRKQHHRLISFFTARRPSWSTAWSCGRRTSRCSRPTASSP